MAESGRGWYVHEFNWFCFNCCCSVCTAEHCPYPQHWGVYKHRCAECVQSNGKMRKTLECDFFENRHTSKRKFRYRVENRERGEIEKRLDAIMKKLGIELPDEND